jgi:RNA polymerase sigma-70 factor, ECF subfamily
VPGDITHLLAGLRAGSQEAEAELIRIVYGELRRMAARYMRSERSDHTLQATALVHEAYVRLLDQRDKDWQNRAHFFGVAAQVMRRILVDHARTRRAVKRGCGQHALSLDDIPLLATEQADEIIALDEALSNLAQFDARQSRIVEMRFFAGLSEEEIAHILGISVRTVKRDWSVAKAWLYAQLRT